MIATLPTLGNFQMTTYSLRNKLKEEQFEVLNSEQYLEKLRIIADESAPTSDRNRAKEDLLNAYLKLIAKVIDKVLKDTRRKGSYLITRNALSIDEVSDLLDSMAGHMFSQLTDMANRASKHGFRLSSAIMDRVAKKLTDKMRALNAQRRTSTFESPDSLPEITSDGEQYSVLESMIMEESYAELRDTAQSLPGIQGLVLQALIYGFETQQDLSLAEIARALKIPQTTARSAYQSAKKKLRDRFPEFANGLLG